MPAFTSEGIDLFTLLLPIICCAVALMLGGRGGPQQKETSTVETDIWYAKQSIEDTYEAMKAEVDKWREDAQSRKNEERSSLSKLKNLFSQNKNGSRFIVSEENSPRLLKINNNMGKTTFELIEVEGGGTTVKATYNPNFRDLIQEFKAKSPLVIPSTPVGDNCPSCGKPVLREFKICPYCGSKLIKT